MIDLDEREEGIDAILRAGGPRLRTAMSQSPIVEFRRPRRSHRRSWLIAIATVVVLVVGLVAIGTNRNDQSIGNNPARLRWLVGGLPDGWTTVSAFDPEGADQTDVQPLITIYATDDAPLGPALLLQASTGVGGPGVTPGSVEGQTNYQETTIDGRRAAFADASTGARVVYVEVDGNWVLMTARNIDDATLREFAGAVVRNDDGSVEIPVDALANGLRLVVSASDPLDPMILSRPGAGVAGSVYKGPADASGMTLAVGSPRLAVRAWDELGYQLKAVEVGTETGYFGTRDNNSVPPSTSGMLYWERDGLAFRLDSFNVSEADLIAAAMSVRPASSPEWEAIVKKVEPLATPGTEVAGTTPGEPAPADTVPAFTGTSHDVDIDVSVDEISPNEQVWSGTLPTGEPWKVEVTRVFDRLSFWFEFDGSRQGGFTGDTIPRPPGQEISCCGPNVVTSNPLAAALRVVRSNGERYTIPLHDLPGTELRIAVIALSFQDGVPCPELIDADGNVLESLPGGS